MIQGHGGNTHLLAERLGCRPDQIHDVSSNINPMGPPPGLMSYLQKHMEAVFTLPEVDSRSAEAQMADVLGVEQNAILAGAGTTQFIHVMFEILRSEKILILGPTYSDYADVCGLKGLQPAYLQATAENDFHPDLQRLDRMAGQVDTVVICNPNNPTGSLIPGNILREICCRHADARFVIDESYMGFLPSAKDESMVSCGLDNVIVLHSISKLYRLAGLRIGFLTAAPEMVHRFRVRRTPWSLNSLAQSAVRYLATQTETIAQFVEQSRNYITRERQLFFERLEVGGRLKAYPSHTTFFLVELFGELSAPSVWERFAREGVLIRDCSNFVGLGDRFIRIAINRAEINEKIAVRLLDFCTSPELQGTH